MRRECKVRHDEEQEENKGAYISEGGGGQDDKATYMHDMHGIEYTSQSINRVTKVHHVERS